MSQEAEGRVPNGGYPEYGIDPLLGSLGENQDPSNLNCGAQSHLAIPCAGVLDPSLPCMNFFSL